MTEALRSFNDAIFFFVNNSLHSSLGDAVIGNATWLAFGWVGYPLALLALVLIDRQQFKRNFVMLLMAGLGEGAVIQVVKFLVHTPRPLSLFHSSIESGVVHVNVMFDPLYSNSFPSGHTQTAFCIAAVLAWVAMRSPMNQARVRILTYTCYGLAALVGVSRMYVGAHFPVDVFAGAIIGVIPVLFITRYFDGRTELDPALEIDSESDANSISTLSIE